MGWPRVTMKPQQTHMPGDNQGNSSKLRVKPGEGLLSTGRWQGYWATVEGAQGGALRLGQAR
jgi:hypothetical protein